MIFYSRHREIRFKRAKEKQSEQDAEKQWKSDGKRKIFMKINKDWATISMETPAMSVKFLWRNVCALTKCYFILFSFCAMADKRKFDKNLPTVRQIQLKL